jgi:putative ABC transport system permease protein
MRPEHWRYTLPLRLRSLLRRERVDQDLDDELRYHVERKTEENIARGMTAQEARREALLEIGGIEKRKEECRDARRVTWLQDLAQDLRYALRMLRRNPGFALAAISTLALGIGATVAMFSIVDTLVLKPLPFPSADRLVRVESVFASTGRGSGIASYPDFIDWRARNHVFDGMAVFDTRAFTLVGAGEPLHLEGAVVSAQLFPMLGVRPSLGRSFLPREDTPSATNGTDPVILSHGLWAREFDSDPSVLGRIIQLNGQPFTIVGVMPASFEFPIEAQPTELWTTIAVDARGGGNAMTAQRGAHYLNVVGLLKPGVMLRKAGAEMDAIADTLNHQHLENKPRTVRIVPEVQALIGPARIPLLVLLGIVGCVLLIACVNVANLLLARAAGRHREMAVRGSLGASRRRAVRQLLTESALLGFLGGGAGLAMALACLKLLTGMIPAEVPRANDIHLDARLLAFTFVVSLLVGILFGFAPALRLSRINLTAALKQGERSSEGKGQTGVRNALVTSEVALAGILLPAAILLVQSFLHLTRVNPGFDPHDVLTFEIDSPPAKQDSQTSSLFHQVVERMSAVPGVISASAAASLPLTGDNIASSFEIGGQPTPVGSRPTADFNAVEPGYFRTLHIPLLAGRDFTERDDLSSTPVVVINRTLAERFFPGKNPIGKHVRPGIGNGYMPGKLPMREIVGVIGDVKQAGLETQAAPEIYAPLAQSPFGTMFIVARTAIDPGGVVAGARRQVAAVDKNTPIYEVKRLDQYFDDSLSFPRLVTLLVGGFAVLAVTLACLGVYGVVSYLVARLTREIGIRVAFGAGTDEILRWILRQGLSPALLGAVMGLILSFGLAHLLSSLLYGVSATDPTTFFVAPVALLGVAALASLIPARRAMHVDPMVALRHE